MAEIRLKNSARLALVDDIDLDWLERRPWELSPSGSVICQQKPSEGRSMTTLARLVYQKAKGVALPSKMVVGHKNGELLDNRRSNLITLPKKLHDAKLGAANHAAAELRKASRPNRPEYHFSKPGHVLLVCRDCLVGIPCDGLQAEWAWCDCRNLAVRGWLAASKDLDAVRVESRTAQ